MNCFTDNNPDIQSSPAIFRCSKSQFQIKPFDLSEYLVSENIDAISDKMTDSQEKDISGSQKNFTKWQEKQEGKSQDLNSPTSRQANVAQKIRPFEEEIKQKEGSSSKSSKSQANTKKREEKFPSQMKVEKIRQVLKKNQNSSSYNHDYLHDLSHCHSESSFKDLMINYSKFSQQIVFKSNKNPPKSLAKKENNLNLDVNVSLNGSSNSKKSEWKQLFSPTLHPQPKSKIQDFLDLYSPSKYLTACSKKCDLTSPLTLETEREHNQFYKLQKLQVSGESSKELDTNVKYSYLTNSLDFQKYHSSKTFNESLTPKDESRDASIIQKAQSLSSQKQNNQKQIIFNWNHEIHDLQNNQGIDANSNRAKITTNQNSEVHQQEIKSQDIPLSNYGSQSQVSTNSNVSSPELVVRLIKRKSLSPRRRFESHMDFFFQKRTPSMNGISEKSTLLSPGSQHHLNLGIHQPAQTLKSNLAIKEGYTQQLLQNQDILKRDSDDKNKFKSEGKNLQRRKNAINRIFGQCGQ